MPNTEDQIRRLREHMDERFDALETAINGKAANGGPAVPGIWPTLNSHEKRFKIFDRLLWLVAAALVVQGVGWVKTRATVNDSAQRVQSLEATTKSE